MKQGYTYQPKIVNLKGEKIENFSPTKSSEKYLIWHIQGGLGKNIAATALCKDLKETHPDRKFILIASWPEVFLNNPYIDRVYQLGQTPHFYEDYVENKDVIIFKHEPYHQTSHITKSKHLIENWCDLLGVSYNHQQPQIFVNYPQQMLRGLWLRSKPIMVIQTGGGPVQGQKYSYSWTRDMPIEIAQKVVQKFQDQYHIIQITRPDGYQLQGVERVDSPLSNIELFALIAASEKRVLIDSCLQHAASAFELPSTVLWIGTSPKVFGYDLHNNISAKLPKKANQLIGSYLFDYQFENNFHECPYLGVEDIFDSEKILNSI
jgi:ADP-heptose:LPS heptosyltransferase